MYLALVMVGIALGNILTRQLIRRVPIASLGVSDFGQSGDVPDLYAHFGIDAETIIGAALDLIDEPA